MRAVEGLAVVARELQTALDAVDPAGPEALADALRTGSSAWFCTGQGRSGLVAAMAAMRLMHLGVRAHLVGEATAPSAHEGDVLLALSASGQTPVTVHLAQTAADRGARVVALTQSPASPLAEVADVVVLLPRSASVQFGGSLFEQTCLALLDAVALSLAPGLEQQEEMQRRHANLQ